MVRSCRRGAGVAGLLLLLVLLVVQLSLPSHGAPVRLSPPKEVHIRGQLQPLVRSDEIATAKGNLLHSYVIPRKYRLRQPWRLFHELRISTSEVAETLRPKIEGICVSTNASAAEGGCVRLSARRDVYHGKAAFSESPYGDPLYLDITLNGASGYYHLGVVEEFARWRLLSLVGGMALLALAPVLSASTPFYYTSGMTFTIVALGLIILYQVLRSIPGVGKRPAFVITSGAMTAGVAWLKRNYLWVLHQLGWEDLPSYAIYVIFAFLFIGAAIGFWLVNKFLMDKDGPKREVQDFVKWGMRSLALLFMFQSTADTPAAVAIVTIALTSMIPYANSIYGLMFGAGSRIMATLERPKAKEHYPPPEAAAAANGHWLSEEEWREQGEICTAAQVEKLIASPEFVRWAKKHHRRISTTRDSLNDDSRALFKEDS